MTDIVKRLRDGFRGQGLARAIRRKEDEPYPGEPYMSMDDAIPLLNEAADEIERLRKALQFERGASNIAGACENYLRELRWKEINALRAEIAKLREALEKIAEQGPTWDRTLDFPGLTASLSARAALQKDEGE